MGGYYYGSGYDGSGHGFIYDGVNWNSLDYPGAMVYGIDGINIVGAYYGAGIGSHGFVYDGVNWNSLDYPGYDIDGDNIVGTYWDGGVPHGFIASPVPEPASLLLLGGGLLGLTGFKRRRIN